jgi:hypothetical protein
MVMEVVAGLKKTISEVACGWLVRGAKISRVVVVVVVM